MTQTAPPQVITPKNKDLGGFSVRRLLPTAQQKMIGPWIFFDHMGPTDFPAGEGIDVRPHPHINLATVTYLFKGEIWHRDSLGSSEAILPGDINLMVAGSGIVHSERERKVVHQQKHHLDGLQLWLALPESDEEIDPAFYHHAASEIPCKKINGVSIRVMMGNAFGLISPVKTFAETLYLEASLQQGQSMTLPHTEERAIYVVKGQVSLSNHVIETHQMVVLSNNHKSIEAMLNNTKIILIGGANIGPRHIDWNFVSSRKERIEQAKFDWRNNRFPLIPGDNKEFIPLPE